VSALHNNTPERLAGLEIDMENRARRRDLEARKRNGFSKATKTASELRLIYRDRGRTLEDDRQGRGLFAILLHTIANTGGDVAAKMTAAMREFAPWLSPKEFERMADEATRVRRKWKPVTLGRCLGLMLADRTRLGITMAWAIDVPKAMQARLREQRKVEARRLKRRAAGVMPRNQYEANALAMKTEAAALGITYDALRKRKQRMAACPSLTPP
jgi:hypothetical protein